ncbi:MAG: heme-degrading domain-containing protein [Pseudaminobacter sp.]|nr:heme-degrading domain-containing protein [Pseudaminobacter sp.]
MSADDIQKIIRQESALVFSAFDEAAAFKIGSALRDRALTENFPIIIDIRLWDRALFYCALPGSTASNTDWARRKINVVKMFQKSTYRMVLEQRPEKDIFPARYGLNPSDYVLAGGGFPVRVEGAGVIGVIAVSGLPERQDHCIVVDAICDHLGLDRQEFALSATAAK